MSNIRLLLLGAPALWVDNQLIELKSAKGMALLAYLGVAKTPHTRDQLTSLLWPDSLPDAARKNLRNTLWAIRKQINDDLLVVDGDWMSLAEAAAVDLRQFEQADQTDPAQVQQVVGLYRGPLLDGLNVVDAPDFELWLTAERERVGQLYLRLLEAQIAIQRVQQDWAGVKQTARLALAADNLQEPMHQILIEAHARLGERADALRQYDSLAKILVHELGVNPLPETSRLRDSILDGSLNPQSAANRAQKPAAAPRPPQKEMSPFVGRHTELAALTEQLQLAEQDQARVTIITGELGIGKTRLWQRWLATLPKTITVLETRCLHTTQSLPFAPLTGLFSHSACLSKLISPDSSVSPIWLAELSRLLPDIRQRLPNLPQPPTLPTDEEHRRLYETFVQVLRALNSRPLLLFVDDLHWVDQATLDWLVYLIDRMQNEPLLLVGTYRPSDASARLSQVVAGWNRYGRLRRLPLARFTIEETSALLAQLGQNGHQTETLQQRSAGNPYFLIELSRNRGDDTPPELAELIRARIERLPDTGRQVLQAAAVLDNNFDFSALRRTSGRGEEETINALDDLLAENLLSETAGGYEFTHPLVAQVLRNDLSLARRSFLHRRAARALESIFPDRLESIAGQLANHYHHAGQPARAAHFAEMAARHAMRLTAVTEAIGFYRQAINSEPSPERRLGLGNALLAQGNSVESRVELRLAAAEFEQAGNMQGVGQTYLALSMSFLASGQGEQVVHWAEQALAQAGSHASPEFLARAHHLLAAGGVLIGHSLAEAEEHLLEAIRLATVHNLPEQAGAGRFELGNVLSQRGMLAQAIESFKAALSLSETAGNLFQTVLAHNNLAYNLTLAGRLPEARHHIETGLALVEKHAFFSPLQYVYSTRGELALAEGALDEAGQWFQRAEAEALRHNNRLHAANTQANLGLVARERGEFDEALLLLESARTTAAEFSAVHLQTRIDLWLAELYQQRGELAAARRSLARAEDRLAGSEREGLQTWAQQLKSALNGA